MIREVTRIKDLIKQPLRALPVRMKEIFCVLDVREEDCVFAKMAVSRKARYVQKLNKTRNCQRLQSDAEWFPKEMSH